MRNFICDGRGGRFHVPSADYGWTHHENARVESHGCLGKHYEFRVMVEINSKGLRDKEYAYGRFPGTARIVVLGDSVVEAAQVEREQPFTEVLEERWSTAQPPVEVVNMGVAGFSTENQLLLYRSEARKYSPDVIVSAFNLANDVAELSPTIHRRSCTGPAALPTVDMTLDANGEISIDTSEFRAFAEEGARRAAQGSYLDFWLTQNLYLYRRAKGLLGGGAETSRAVPVSSQASFPEYDVYLDPPAPEWKLAWDLAAATYRQLAREVARDGGKLVVAILPSKEVVSEEKWRELLQQRVAGRSTPGQRWDREAPRRRIVAILSDLGIPFVDVTDEMRDAFTKTGTTGFFDYDPHPTADGHRRLADALATPVGEWLKSARQGH